eukprot:513047-Pyramimonas_sp.AAC.1
MGACLQRRVPCGGQLDAESDAAWIILNVVSYAPHHDETLRPQSGMVGVVDNARETSWLIRANDGGAIDRVGEGGPRPLMRVGWGAPAV